MINIGRNIEPRGGARPVCVRQERPRRRGRTDAQERVEDCLAKVRVSCALSSKTIHDGRTEEITKSSQP